MTSPDDGVTFAVDNPKFEVQTVGSTASLKLKAGESLDFESDADEDGNVTLMVTATDDEGNTSAPTPVTVAVTNVNEAPSVVAQAMTVDAAKADEIDPDLTIPENSDGKAPGAVVAHIAVSDPDAGDSLTVAVSDDDRFEVIDAHGEKWLKLKEGQSLDHEGEPTIEVTLTATDDGDPAMSGTHKVTITVTDANDAPSITVQKATVPEAKAAEIDPDLTIPEDSDGSIPGAVVAHIAVSDPDAGDTHTVTASDDRFEVIDAHGQKWLKLKEGAKLDHETEGTIEVTVTVTDQDGLSDSMPVTVTVTDADEAPSAPKPGSGTANINENFLGASITTVGGSVDPEGDDITYRVDNPDFEITGDGILKLRDGASLDFEEQPTVTVNLTAVDSKGNVSEPTPVTVTVGDLHENAAPSVAVAPGQDLTVQETGSAEAGALLIELETSDDDADDTHTVTVAGDDRFETREADDGTWSLVLKEGASLDHEDGDGTITLTLTAADDGDPAASGTAEVVIEVTDANEAPTVTVTGGATVPNDDMTVSSLTVEENRNGSELAAPLALITLADPDDGEALKGQAAADKINITGEQADKFTVKLDPEDGLWLALKEGASLNHEDDDSIDLTVTFADKGGLTASASATVTVSDVNEAPVRVKDDKGMPVKELPMLLANTGQPVNWTNVDLTGLFVDPDNPAQTLDYELYVDDDLLEGSGDPIKDKLTLTVEHSEADDGSPKITGTISGGTIWTNHTLDNSPFDITIRASDGLLESTEDATFKVLLEDGNDDITAILLYHPADADGVEARNVDYEVGVDENDASRVVLGRVEVKDPDDPDHPHGQHKVTVDNEKFNIEKDDDGHWLVLKEGNALDHEMAGQIQLTITAMSGTKFDGKGELVVDPATAKTQTVDVIVNDLNDAPIAIGNKDNNPGIKPGNWWVTVDDNLDAETVTAGQWLRFRLEPDTSKYPAFIDKDRGRKGDLEYELVGDSPDWLEITPEGVIQNRANMLAPESDRTYTVTVKATDNKGADGRLSDEFTFKLVVAFSDSRNADNYDPQIVRGQVEEINEKPDEDVLVATFTVRDEDIRLEGHPFAPNTPTVMRAVKATDDSGDYRDAFVIKHVRDSGDTSTYRIVTTKKAGELLDHEDVDEIRITLRVQDEAGGMDERDILVDIRDLNEKPVKATTYSGHGHMTVTVDQEESSKQYLWINLHDFWNDPDGGQDDDDLMFTVGTPNADWIKVLHQPQPWQDIEAGPDDDLSDRADNVIWGTIKGVTAGVAGGSLAAIPGADDYVVVIEIDRTEANNKQADVGKTFKFDLIATDDGRPEEKGSQTISIRVTDGNLNIDTTDDPLTIDGILREGKELTAKFDKTADPDLAGNREAYQVRYIWSRVDQDTSDGDDSAVVQDGGRDTYVLTQGDVGHKMKVEVQYLEVLPAGTISTSAQSVTLEAETDSVIRNEPNKGDGEFSILVDGTAGLIAQDQITDGDGKGSLSYQWQSSQNGIGGWTDVSGEISKTLTLPSNHVAGRHYRLEVTYTDGAGTDEAVYSDPVQVSKLAAAPASIALAGQGIVGGTLEVTGAGTNAKVKWQMRKGVDETGGDFWVDIVEEGDDDGLQLDIVREYSQEHLRAVVTGEDSNGVTYSTAVAWSGRISGPLNDAPEAKSTDAYKVEGQINYAMHGADEDGVTVVTETIDLKALFNDPDGDTLTYSVQRAPGTNLGSISPSGDWFTQHSEVAVEGGLIFIIDKDKGEGKLTYITDDKGGHDDSAGRTGDGAGNYVSFMIRAEDEEGLAAQKTVNIHLNVKPSRIDVTHSRDTEIKEGVKISADTTVATLNVQDENSVSHKFGTHKVTVVDDERFQVVNDTDSDGSTWLLQVKKGAMFNFDEGTATTPQNVKVKLTATDENGDGKSLDKPVEITVRALDIINDPDDDPDDDPDTIPATKVPGLDDDETPDPDETEDDGTDGSQEDGGWNPEDDMMSSIAMLDDGLF